MLCGQCADLGLDKNADRQPLTWRRLQWHIERNGHNLKSRGLQNAMERHIKCYNGRW